MIVANVGADLWYGLAVQFIVLSASLQMHFILIKFKGTFLHISSSVLASVIGTLIDGSFDHRAVWINLENVDGSSGCEEWE